MPSVADAVLAKLYQNGTLSSTFGVPGPNSTSTPVVNDVTNHPDNNMPSSVMGAQHGPGYQYNNSIQPNIGYS